MFLKITMVLFAVLAGLSIYVALQPAEYMVTRSVTINAPAEKIFPYLNNAKLMNSWNPWMEIDPKVVAHFSGPEEGVGARTSWQSEGQMGTGSATVTKSTLNQLVGTRIEFEKPMVMVQDAETIITPKGGQSEVTWLVRGKNSFMGRFMCFFMNMDKMVGGTFEKGLQSLKSKVEKS